MCYVSEAHCVAHVEALLMCCTDFSVAVESENPISCKV
jgi:hypothetical protein